MLLNVKRSCRTVFGFGTLFCLLITGLCQAQIVDPKALGGTTRCIKASDSLYTITVDVQSPAACPFTSYTITWDAINRSRGETQTAPGPVSHVYNLKDLLKNCGQGIDDGERLIKVETDCRKSPGDKPDNKSFSIYFVITPIADISAPDACENRLTYLQNKTCPQGAGMTWKWDFGDGTTSTSASPSKVFSASATAHTVSLSASNGCGNSSKTITIPVRKTPEAKMKPTGYSYVINDVYTSCLPTGGTVTMDATTSLDGTSYQWSVTPATYRFVQNTNSGSPVAKIEFTKPGDYIITLVAFNDCGTSKPVICKHSAVDLPTVSLDKQPGLCQDGTYTLKGTTPGASYSLNGSAISPGQSINVTVSSTPYIVTGSAGNECGVRTVADTFLVQSPQAVQIALPGKQTAVCAGTARFALPINLTGGTWDGTGKGFVETSGANAFFNPRIIGQYTLIYNRGTGVCSRSDTVRVNVEGGQPTVQNVSVCGSETFVKLRGDPAGGTGTWSSNTNPGAVRGDTLFLAGLTATQLQVTYQVRYGVSGCLSTTTATVNIGRPKSLFTITGACSNSAPQVQNQSTGGTVFEWTLNGRPVPAVGLPVFTLAPGVNQIQLKVGAGTCSDVSTQTLAVVAPPAPVAITSAFVSDCSPMRVTLTPSGTASPDVQYAWNLGPGGSSTAFAPPVQTYTNQTRLAQPISISLTASNGCGRQTAATTVTVRPLAKAEIGVDSTLVRCTPARVRFSNRSTGQAASTWLFGDGSGSLTTTADTLSHLFSARDSARTYRVQLVVNSQCGRDTARVAVRVIPTLVRPLITLNTATPCPGERVTMTDATTPKPTRVIWRLNDGTTQVTPVANWTFSQPNTTYTVSMTALTECGFDSTRRILRTTTLPTGGFSATPGVLCAGQSVQLANRTDPALRFRWDFGDGSPVDSVTYAPRHAYTRPGSYSLTLSVFSGTSLSCQLVVPGSVTVSAKPVAAIQIIGDSVQCLPGKVSLQAGAGLGINTWQWQLGDGRQFSGNFIDVPLIQAGTFDVSLTVINGVAGCADSTRRQASLQAIRCDVQTPDAFSPNHDGIGDSWTLFGSGITQINLLRIRSRWGEVVYEATNLPASSLRPGECWDGTFNGTPMPAGSYTYESEIVLRGNRMERRVGSVELRR